MGRFLFRWRSLLAWGAAAGLAALAWYLKHPLMLWLRAWETPILLFVGMAGGGAGLAKGRRSARLLGLVFLAIATATVYRELEFAATRAEVHAAGPAMRAVGGHFIVGFRSISEIESLAEKGLIGGLYVTRRNLQKTTPQRLAAEIASLQERRLAAGLPLLIVAADQEGGEVSHLSPWLTAMPALATLADAGRTAAGRARDYGRDQGRELAALGINLNFGPVADLRPTDGSFPGDRLTRIHRRAIAGDPVTVDRVARAYAAGLADQGVGATFKHFPGLGRVRADTHFQPAVLRLPVASLEPDWLPYRALPPSAAVMVGHVTLAAEDPARAASHSRKVIAGLLRERLGHNGLVITDDLDMGAVYGRGIGTVAGEALAAGADFVLVSYDPDQLFRALTGAAAALQRGEIPPDALADSRERIAAFFEALAQGRQTAPEAAGIW